jgi:hypothetical protein
MQIEQVTQGDEQMQEDQEMQDTIALDMDISEQC